MNNNQKLCTVCDIKLNIINYKRDRTVCNDCYNKNRRKKYNKQKSRADLEKRFESITGDITHSSSENNITLESLNNKINDVLKLLEVIKSRLPRSPRT